jgi:flagellar biosynthesis protein FliQ
MSVSEIVEFAIGALFMAFVLSGPILIALLVVGLIIGILQASTSVNESSVAFIPKLIVIGVVFVLAGPAILSLFVDYLRNVIVQIPSVLN